jgi:hypothetical protein
MPFSFHADERAHIFHVQAMGEVDDAQVNDLWDRLSHEAAFITGWPILCDCSALTGLHTSSGVIESLAKTTRGRHSPLAIIAPQASVFGLARMYQILSDPDDQRIHVFTRPKPAMEWLKAGIKEATLHT